jgi:hypothetical protein
MENNVPCYGCEKRRAENGYNCHSDCPDYKAFKEEQTNRAESIRKKKAEEADITDFRIQSMARGTRDKSKQNAWKG